MKKSFLAAFLTIGIFAVAGSASAGGKPSGAKCHVHKSCQSNLCVRANPGDKFGACCAPETCPSLNAQCGDASDGCGGSLFCGSCDFQSTCENNECVPLPTTTSTTNTTNTTTTTTLSSSCLGQCGSDAPSGCWCDSASCIAGDGCADRDFVCPDVCTPVTTTLF